MSACLYSYELARPVAPLTVTKMTGKRRRDKARKETSWGRDVPSSYQAMVWLGRS